MRFKNFCFTIYACSPITLSILETCDVNYIVYGNEICPDTGRQHYQGYCELKLQKTISAIQKLFKNKMHIEKRKGSSEQASVYCKKDNDFVERGIISRQGTRNDIKDIIQKVKDGFTMKEILEECPSFQATRFVNTAVTKWEKPRNWTPEVYWYYGLPGTGKTTYAESLAPDAWISPGDTLKWWDDYDADEDIILDDFRPSHCSWTRLLRILDHTKCRIEFKGGSRQLLAKRIFITADKHPVEMYKHQSEHIGQLLRRITEIKIFTKDIRDGTIVPHQKENYEEIPKETEEIYDFEEYST